MTYQVLARRFRPKTFQEVVGQEGVTGTLVQGLKSGRIPHAWLFAGPRGVGKTTTARILARAVNCEKGPTPEPCGVCPVCKDFRKEGILMSRRSTGPPTGVSKMSGS